MSAIAAYAVTGMTCGHCVVAVTDEVNALPGVVEVTVELRPGGTSTVNVTSSEPLEAADVRVAIGEAGYELADVNAGHEARR
jgi:copper chaperone CopZ